MTKPVRRRLDTLEGEVVSLADATVTISADEHKDKILVLNRAAGVTATLPPATGSGDRYVFIAGTSVTSNSYKVQVTGDDVLRGLSDTLASADAGFATASTSDTLTWNGTTTGGLAGSYVEFIDIAADTYFVKANSVGSGTAATPFSAAVS